MFPKIGVPPNHPFLIGFSITNHPFWGIPIFEENPRLVPNTRFLGDRWIKLEVDLFSVGVEISRFFGSATEISGTKAFW